MLKTRGGGPQSQYVPQEAAWDRLRCAEPARVDDDPPATRRVSRTTPVRGRSQKAASR